jgi:hypothetical protein
MLANNGHAGENLRLKWNCLRLDVLKLFKVLLRALPSFSSERKCPKHNFR